MNAQARWFVVVAAGILFGIILLFSVLLLIARFNVSPVAGPFQGPIKLFPRRFESNGERIYFTGMSESGYPITAEMPGLMPGKIKLSSA